MNRTASASNIVPSRRQFLQAALAGAGALGTGLLVGPAVAAEPPRRVAGPHMKLSLAAYSFRESLPRNLPLDRFNEAQMTLDDFIQFCAEQNLDACEPTAYYFPTDVSNAYLLHLKELAFRLGLDVSGTAIGNDFCLPEGPQRDAQIRMCNEWIDRAAVLGAPVIRIFAGKVPKGDSEEAAIERCVAGINECLTHAAEKGVHLALENHGGITATPEQMMRIISGVEDSLWFGVNFDSGNFRTDDPYRDLAKIAPHAINAQIKTEISPNNRKQPADLARLVGILKDAGYRGYVVLEYEADEEPKEAIPRHLDELRRLIDS